jgi:hypothetical protein
VFFAIVDVWSTKFTSKNKTNPIQTLPFRELYVLISPILHEENVLLPGSSMSLIQINKYDFIRAEFHSVLFHFDCHGIRVLVSSLSYFILNIQIL